jgi:hypothetical protein
MEIARADHARRHVNSAPSVKHVGTTLKVGGPAPIPAISKKAERTFSILHGGGQLVSHSLSAHWKVR